MPWEVMGEETGAVLTRAQTLPEECITKCQGNCPESHTGCGERGGESKHVPHFPPAGWRVGRSDSKARVAGKMQEKSFSTRKPLMEHCVWLQGGTSPGLTRALISPPSAFLSAWAWWNLGSLVRFWSPARSFVRYDSGSPYRGFPVSTVDFNSWKIEVSC